MEFVHVLLLLFLQIYYVVFHLASQLRSEIMRYVTL